MSQRDLPDRRPLGDSALSVRPLCLGGNVFGWTLDERRSFEVLDAFIDAGFDFIDTADSYSRWAPGNSGGESERIIGNWFAASGKRDRVVLATKIGNDMGGDRKGLSARWIRQGVEDSLQRLRTDRIDLYQSHKDDLATPQEETLRAYDDLVRAGKVRVIGASNFSAARLESALDVARSNGLPRYASLQPEYNLYSRAEFERELQPLCQRAAIGVIPFYGLASGFLSGKYRTPDDAVRSARGPGVVAKYLNPRGLRIVAAQDEVAARLGATNARVAIAWLMAQPTITAPIVSATDRAQVEDLVAATRLQLDREALAALDRASAT
jgi:aryl-alcohol dehydrogenase-like predicted oxidoreductase